ncbi:universal stress protein [Halorhabdus amylolytica]|uniref:universal stress protein n=1 Tax=Halorhabdus amylolytica TaxID=2559573 RepID=UPI00145AB335|nr:universal stress protein [Halorhabdus amylolytica]
MALSLAVVMTGSDKEIDLLETATAFSECRDSGLVVLRLASPDEFEEVADTMETIGDVEQTSYGDDDIREGLKNDAQKAAAEATADTDISTDVFLRVVEDDERADAILEVARENDCDHVFLVGQRRSPTGKALFGDVTQKVILNFDGEITLSME